MFFIIMSDYNKQLKIANRELETELDKLTNQSNTYERINEYAQQDSIMITYTQKMLMIVYVIIFVFFSYAMYVESRPYYGFMIALFLLLPVAFWLVGKYFTDALMKAIKLFINGNAAYLYAK